MILVLFEYLKSHLSNEQKYDGHVYYIMAVKFNPKDSTSFASVSLDRSVKVGVGGVGDKQIWSISQSHCNYSLLGHQKGINCLDYYPGTDKPYLITGSDDLVVSLFLLSFIDYQSIGLSNKNMYSNFNRS